MTHCDLLAPVSRTLPLLDEFVSRPDRFLANCLYRDNNIVTCTFTAMWRIRNVRRGGEAKGLGSRSPPVGSKGKDTVGSLVDYVPRSCSLLPKYLMLWKNKISELSSKTVITKLQLAQRGYRTILPK